MSNISVEHDLKQRELALNITESFIIQAPAGSGKTELLIQRLLALLANVNSPEEIIAITFTKKAANEMRERVIDALKDAVETNEPESAHKRKTWHLARNVLRRDKEQNWHLLANPNQMQIKTIDSLCSYLTTQLPLLAQFGSQPSISDTPDYLYEEAAQYVLMQIEEDAIWSDSIAALLLHLDNDLNQLKSLLVTLLAKRDQWLPHIFNHASEEAITTLLEQHVELIEADALTTAELRFPTDLYSEALDLLTYATNNLNAEIDTDGSALWRNLAALLLTKAHTWRKTVTAADGFPAPSSTKNAEEKRRFTAYKDRMKNLLLELESNLDLKLALEDIARLPKPGTQRIESAILEHLVPILKLAAAQLRVSFQLHGKIDFIENALAALIALGSEEDPTNLALALDYKIRHILVDEFQDTSSTQYSLLRKLTHGWQTGDGRTLFVVGDPMQSIYRFREAEVGLFLRMREHGLDGIKLTPLTLALNFRSLPDIVNWNNTHFTTIFPQNTNAATGAVSYSPSVATKESSGESLVEICGFNPPQAPHTQNVYGLQSEHITAKMSQWLRDYPEDNIAILVRSRSHLKSIISTIRDSGIPYQAIEIDKLSDRQMVLDLLSLTAALLHQADRIAWLSVLRAPWCGLSLSDLVVISDCKRDDIIWQRINQEAVLEKLSKQGQHSLKRILPSLQRGIALRGRRSLREWIESTWLLLGGPACLANDADRHDAQTFFASLAQLENDNAQFDIDQLKEKISKAYAAAHNDSKLQIMTIHAAKGLEFDSVIIPHLEKSLPSDDKSLMVWMEHTLRDKQTALMLAPVKAADEKKNSAYEYIRWQQKIKSQFETDRLFYVAATRAKKRLSLCFERKANLANDSFLKKLEPFINNVTLDEKVVSGDSPEKTTEHFLSRLSTTWHNPFQQPKQRTNNTHNTFTGFTLGTDLPRKTGIVIHAILQQLAQRSINWWQQLNTEQMNVLVNNLLSLQAFTSDEISIVQPIILNAIDKTIADKKGQWILHPHQDAQAEYTITANTGDEYANLVIDRTFIDADNTRWIIDYKTSQPSDNLSLDEFLAHEKEAYTEQMQTYAVAMRHITPGDIKLGLYFPMISGWIEW